MENGSRKRKMENVEQAAAAEEDDAEEEEEEEEKIDKFFAILRSTKEVRDRLRFQSAKDEIMEKPAPAGGWCPAFQVEDFMEESFKAKGIILQAREPSKMEEEEEEEEEEEQKKKQKEKGQGSGCLDLNLSL